MKQGQLGGILKELGYTEDQVSDWDFACVFAGLIALQVFKF